MLIEPFYYGLRRLFVHNRSGEHIDSEADFIYSLYMRHAVSDSGHPNRTYHVLPQTLFVMEEGIPTEEIPSLYGFSNIAIREPGRLR